MKHASFVFTLLLASASVAAQQPNAGQLLQELRPAPSLPAPKPSPTAVEERPATPLSDGERVTVRRFHITGTTAFAEADLLPLVADAIGKEQSLADLDALALRITRRYRDAGYLVARAYLPAQDVTDGTVEIAVLEGRLGKVDIDNTAGVSASALAPLDKLVPGDSLLRLKLENTLLTLADLPGVTVTSTLRPGAALGTSDLVVDVAPGPALNGSVDFDSFGNRYTGTYRLGTSLFWNDPAHVGDQASLRAQASDGSFDYGRVGYQLPLGEAATRVGVAWSQMRYRLGEDFAALNADGAASVGSLYLLHPLRRSRESNWYGQLQYDRKRLTDRIGSTSTTTDKALENWTLALNGNAMDALGGGGSNTLTLAYTQGRLGLDAVTDVIDQATARSGGSFAKLNLGLQRTQHLVGRLDMAISYSEQWADKNLDSSEKFTLGGAYGVRAYPQGEAASDEGRLFSAELHWQASDAWQVQGFYDDGRATINRNPWTTAANGRDLAGYGVGAAYAGGGFTLRMFAAWKAGTGKPTSDIDRTPRIWVQAAKYF